MESFNAPEWFIKKELDKLLEADLYIYPEHWNAIQQFTRMRTQWVISPTGSRIGLKYESVDAFFNLVGIPRGKKRVRLFEEIQLLERGALQGFAAKQ